MELPPGRKIKNPYLTRSSKSVRLRNPASRFQQDPGCQLVEEQIRNDPRIKDNFKLCKYLGRGTFGCVYKVRLKKLPIEEFFALKCFRTGSSPSRLANEVRILRRLGGKYNIIELKFCLRLEGSFFMGMSYFPNDDFTEVVKNALPDEILSYIQNLLGALEYMHDLGIVHRDIKPSNFLYNRSCRKYRLIDFGLAQDLKETKENKTSKPPKKKLLGSGLPPMKRRKLLEEPGPSSSSKVRRSQCQCFGEPMRCNICKSRPDDDVEHTGTSGFRAPEVLLRSSNQDQAVDIWAAGVILLTLLSRKNPFFRPKTDSQALFELALLFGSWKLEELCEKRLRKHFQMSPNYPGLSLRKVCRAFRCLSLEGAEVEWTEDPSASCVCSRFVRFSGRAVCVCGESGGELGFDDDFPEWAYDLLEKLLEVDVGLRLTAKQAMYRYFHEQSATL